MTRVTPAEARRRAAGAVGRGALAVPVAWFPAADPRAVEEPPRPPGVPHGHEWRPCQACAPTHPDYREWTAAGWCRPGTYDGGAYEGPLYLADKEKFK